MPGFEGIDPAQRLLDMLNPHRDVPPVQNADDGLADRGADQTRKRRFAIAKDRHGSAGPPSFFAKRLAQRRQRRDRTLGARAKRRGGLPAISILPTVTSMYRD
jgi:hypothetical protein